MSTLKIKFIESTELFEFVQENLRHDYIDVMVYLDTSGEVVQLSDVQYSISIKNRDDVISEIKYPVDGVQLIKSNQPVLSTHRVQCNPDAVLDVNVSRGAYSDSDQITVPSEPEE